MPPNLLAHYLYLGETTVVPQAIETVRTSVSSGGQSSSYWCQQRHHISKAIEKAMRSAIAKTAGALIIIVGTLVKAIRWI
jgi:hypothetical protein